MSILVVSEHNMFREGLGVVLQTRYPETGIRFAETCQSAIASRRPGKDPATVLLDLGLREVRDEDAVPVLRRAYPGSMLIGLADTEDHPEVQRSFRAGVRLCVLKSASPEVLVAALRLADSEGICLPAYSAPMDAPDSVSSGLPRTGQPTPADLGLTPKQSRVLTLLLQGKSAKIIARDLGLCTGTVKTHTTAVLRALNVKTRVQAVLAARQIGLKLDSFH